MPKSQRPFRLPLLDQHRLLLKHAATRGHPRWVWASNKTTGAMGAVELSSFLRPKFDYRWTPHDLRRVFRTAAIEAEVPEIAANLLMNHAPPHGVLGSYVSLDTNLRPAMERIVARIETRLGRPITAGTGQPITD